MTKPVPSNSCHAWIWYMYQVNREIIGISSSYLNLSICSTLLIYEMRIKKGTDKKDIQ